MLFSVWDLSLIAAASRSFSLRSRFTSDLRISTRILLSSCANLRHVISVSSLDIDDISFRSLTSSASKVLQLWLINSNYSLHISTLLWLSANCFCSSYDFNDDDIWFNLVTYSSSFLSWSPIDLAMSASFMMVCSCWRSWASSLRLLIVASLPNIATTLRCQRGGAGS